MIVRDNRGSMEGYYQKIKKDRQFNDLLAREMEILKINYLNDIENHKKNIARSTKNKKGFIPINVQTLELNFYHARPVVNTKSKVHNLTGMKHVLK